MMDHTFGTVRHDVFWQVLEGEQPATVINDLQYYSPGGRLGEPSGSHWLVQVVMRLASLEPRVHQPS